MKFTLLLSLLFSSFVAHADVIHCVFTEPFVNSTYSMTQSKLTYRDSEGKETIYQNVSFQIRAAGTFEIQDANKNVLQVLNLNNQGSDGMSDSVFPYDVQDKTSLTGEHGGRGGCVSNLLKATSVEN
jgi:hypothetical protein